MPYFKRDKAAANVQEADWRKLVKLAQRQFEYVPKPCAYCGITMTLNTQETQGNVTNETKDHITPRCKGGVITVACCEGCNRDKHHLSMNEWRCVLMFRRRRPVVFYFERIAAQNALVNLSSLLSRLLSC